jgi:hypothetical protein
MEPTTAKFLSLSSEKSGSAEEERRCFFFLGVEAKLEAEGVEVEAAGAGLRRFGSTSTCAVENERVSQSERKRRGDTANSCECQ